MSESTDTVYRVLEAALENRRMAISSRQHKIKIDDEEMQRDRAELARCEREALDIEVAMQRLPQPEELRA